MLETEEDREKKKEFLTKLFVRVAQQSAPSMGLDLLPEDIERKAAEQVRSFFHPAR